MSENALVIPTATTKRTAERFNCASFGPIGDVGEDMADTRERDVVERLKLGLVLFRI